MNKVILKSIYTFISLVIMNVAFAQDVAKEVRKLMYDAEEYYRIEEYHNALPLLIKANELDSEDSDINYMIGICYLKGTYRAKALPFFERSMEIGGTTTEIYYNLARCYHLTHEFDKAIMMYEKAHKYLSTYPEGTHINKSLIERQIDMCEYGKVLVKTPLDFRIENMGDHINSPQRDHVPVISADETTLIFTSRRPYSEKSIIDENDGMYFEDMYISNKEGEEWGTPIHMGEDINQFDEHDASVGLSPDGQRLFIYKSAESSANGLYSGNLYTSVWDNGIWGVPTKMMEGDDNNGINTKHVEPSASISADENVMYFSSDRPGGKGGLDIYIVKKLPNGEWALPKNLEEINTPFDDDAPFIHSDNRTLYFSSKGNSTMGGFDIFMTVHNESNDTWSEPQNMGYPVNTADDDIYFVWSADGERGYFSSLREDSYGDLDIYVVHRPVIGKYFMVLKGTVLDQDTKEPVSATIFLFDEKEENIIGVYNTKSETGKFSAIIPPNTKYLFKIQSSGYDEVNQFVQTPDVKEYFEQEEIFYVKRKPAESVEKIDTNERPKVGETFALENVYFDFDKFDVREDAKLDLEIVVDIMKRFTGIKIEIGAHTDSKGSEEYNELLSGKRAKSVVDYLASKGIDRGRLSDKAYGESNPIVGNDTDENRQKNRRVEFKVIESKRK